MNRLLSTPLLVLLVSFALATGQEIGTEICACSPRSYEFTLDFSLTCPPVNITLGDAIEATSCLVSPFGVPNVKDLVPVAVESINILELGQNLRVVAQTDIKDVLVDGDKFLYTSLVADPDSIEEVGEVPRALQLNIVGTNQVGDRIINVFIVTFTNECGSYPLFQEGQSAGWARFTGFGPGSPELCSAIESGTTDSAPATSPPVATDAPISPTLSPVALLPDPTDAPVAATAEPTKAPVVTGPTPFPMQRLSPTLAPTKDFQEETDSSIGMQFDEVPPDTDSPTSEPTPGTVAPVVEVLPTDAPVEIEVDTMEPTKAPVEIAEVVVDPTEAPVETVEEVMDPTEAPVETVEEVMDPTEDAVETVEEVMDPTEDAVEIEEDVMDQTEDPVDQDDDFDFPSIDVEDEYGDYVPMSMSMSMSMSLGRLLSESHKTNIEFGDQRLLRNLGVGVESDKSDTKATKSDKKAKKSDKKDEKSDKKAKKSEKDTPPDQKSTKSDKKSGKSEKDSKKSKENPKKSKETEKDTKSNPTASKSDKKASKSEKDLKKSKEHPKKSKGPEKDTKPNPTASKSDKKASKSEKESKKSNENSKKSKGPEKSKLEKSIKSPKRLRELETTAEDTSSNGFSRLRV